MTEWHLGGKGSAKKLCNNPIARFFKNSGLGNRTIKILKHIGNTLNRRGSRTPLFDIVCSYVVNSSW